MNKNGIAIKISYRLEVTVQTMTESDFKIYILGE